MGSSEKFCLRWNDFESNISVSFRELREDKELFDITLACEDEEVKAHKVILSACSPFFRSILKRYHHDHPLLYLKGVKFSELQAVLNFMYQGEVNVAQEDLNSFLAVAEELKVKGLTQSHSKPSSPPPQPPSKSRSRDPPEREPAPPSKRSRPSSNSTVNNKKPVMYDPDVQEIAPTAAAVKTEPAQDTGAMSAVEQYVAPVGAVDTMAEYSEEYGDYEGGGYEGGYDDSMMDSTIVGTPSADGNKELDDIISTMSTKQRDETGLIFWLCVVCQYKNPSMTNLTNHIERNHLNTTYNCPKCPKVFRSRHAIKTHLYRLHDNEPQTCNICHKIVGSKKELRTHSTMEHGPVSSN